MRGFNMLWVTWILFREPSPFAYGHLAPKEAKKSSPAGARAKGPCKRWYEHKWRNDSKCVLDSPGLLTEEDEEDLETLPELRELLEEFRDFGPSRFMFLIACRNVNDSSGVYICKSEENDLEDVNYICQSEENARACIAAKSSELWVGEGVAVRLSTFVGEARYPDADADAGWLLLAPFPLPRGGFLKWSFAIPKRFPAYIQVEFTHVNQ